MNDIAGIADAVRASITSEQPVDVPGASGYQVHSKAYFDGPLDRDRITMLSQVMSLFVLTEGDPNAPEHFLREDHLEINDEIFRYENLSRNFGGVSDLPAEGEGTAPRFAQTTAWEAAFDPDKDGWPAFPNVVLKDAFDL